MSASDPSAPQRIAADPTHSAWVTANAGSGKTKVLIDRVARLLLGRPGHAAPPPDPSKILCLTYTRAAAANMQNKLFARLGAWALMEDDRLRAALTDLDPDHGHAIELARARRLFAQALETPGGLKIQTIHAFCEGLLRRFPLEARISPHFELLDEVASRALMREARDRTILRGLGAENAALRDATVMLVDRVQEFGIDDLVAAIVSRRAAFEGTADAVIARIARALGVERDASVEEARRATLKALDRARLRDLAIAFQTGGKHETSVAPEILTALEDGDDARVLRTLRGALLTKTGEPRKSIPTRAVRTSLPWAEEFCVETVDALVALRDRERAIRSFRGSAAVARFGVALLGEVKRLKREADALDFDDLIRLASDLLNRADARDWVRYKLDGGVDHILVDEAQDTSAEQWQVIGAIAEEFFAGTGAQDTHRTLFVVGDEKQSIYSFQGADPRGLSSVKRRFEALTAGTGGRLEEPKLLHSFRSTPAVLGAVDAVFAEETAHRGLSGEGGAPQHLAYRENQPGRVEYWPVVAPEDDPPEQPWYKPVDEQPPNAPHLKLARGIADRIQGWLREGTRLDARDRAIRPGDILILVRRRNVFANAVIRELKQRGIPVAGEDRMVLTDQLAVRDLMALARFVLLPDDDLTLAAVLRSPVVGISEQDLFDLAHGREGRRLWSVLHARRTDPRFAEAYSILDDLQGQADFLRPYEFLERALTRHGARARFLGRLGVQAEDPIDELLSQALAFETAEIPTLQAFVERIESSGFEVKREMEQGRDEVRVMTAHGAKGLEANIVFLPDTVALPPADRSGLFVVAGEQGPAPLWSQRRADDAAPVAAVRETRSALALEEYRRLLYVAMTRARDWLIVCGYRGSREAKADSWTEMVAAGFGGATTSATPFPDCEGRTIESRGSAREKPDPLEAAAWRPTPPDPALMRPAAREGGTDAPVSPSRLMEDDPTDPPPLPVEEHETTDAISSAERGTLMHALLERLAPLPEAERRSRGLEGLRLPTEEAILGRVLAILADPDFAWIFGKGSLAEVPIAGPVAALDGRPVSGLIDRLIVGDEAVDIVDFKSGRPGDPVPEAYLRQLAVYRAVLGEIYPERRIRAHLLWLDAGRIDTLDDASLSAALERTRDALREAASTR